MRQIRGEHPPARRTLDDDELYVAAKELQAPYELVKEVAETGKLPVVLFTAGGIATPADAAMMMQLGAEGVFVGSGIFKSGNPAQRAEAIVKATTFYDDPDVIAKVSRGLGEAMVGINVDDAARVRAARRAAAGDRATRAPRRRRPRPAGRRPRAPAALDAARRATRSRVRRPEELDRGRRAGLPGGESTTMSKLARHLRPARAAARSASRDGHAGATAPAPG